MGDYRFDYCGCPALFLFWQRQAQRRRRALTSGVTYSGLALNPREADQKEEGREKATLRKPRPSWCLAMSYPPRP